MQKLVLDIESGAETYVDLDDDEAAELSETQTAISADLAAAEATRQRIADAKPSADIIAKLRDGTSLTASERDAVVRYLALDRLGAEV